MHQRLGRVTMSDGTGLAIATVGAGPPLVYVMGWLTHVELSWELAPERELYESLAQGRRLVRYDRAGFGLSDSTTRSPSLDFELEQLGAVVSSLGIDRFDLMGASMGALVATAWAAQHPESVRRLVLYGGWARGGDLSPREVQRHLLGLIDAHWGLGTEVLTDIFAPDADRSLRAAFARYQRSAASATAARALLALSYELDISSALGQVRAPTLVVQRADDRAVPAAEARRLAKGISGAELIIQPGRSHLPYVGDREALVRVVRHFLGLPALVARAPILTPRQQQVAQLVSDGCTNREIADRLGINERSAEGHVERIRTRLGFRSRAQIAAWHAARSDEPGALRAPPAPGNIARDE